MRFFLCSHAFILPFFLRCFDEILDLLFMVCLWGSVMELIVIGGVGFFDEAVGVVYSIKFIYLFSRGAIMWRLKL